MPRAASFPDAPTWSTRSPTSGPSPATYARPIRTGTWSRRAAPSDSPPSESPQLSLHGFGALLLVLLLAACGGERDEPEAPLEQPERLTLTAVGYDALPGWNADDPTGALAAFRRSCTRMAAVPADRPMGGLPELGTFGRWQ